MSEEQAEKKKREVEEVEAERLALEEAAKTAACPYCNKLISDFEYLTLLPGFGWVECTGCGVVFQPDYIRKEKLKRSGGMRLIKPV